MTDERFKVPVPYRNPGEYTAFLDGVRRGVALFGMEVDSLAWGGGIPNYLTVYKLKEDEKPAAVITVDVDPNKPKKKLKKKSAKSATRTQ
jgi:hypothetical protein